MTDTEKTANEIVDAVAAAVEAAAPAVAGAAAPAVILAAEGIKAIISYAEQFGHGDAVRAMLDAELASARQANDAALAAKRAKP